MKTQKSRLSLLQVANIVAYVAVLAVNILSNALPLNGRTAAEISDALPSFFTPAGYTFSIWGIIYLALFGFIAFQARPSQQERPYFKRVGWLFVLSSAANIAWLFSWHYGFYALSILFMVSLLLSLIAIYLRLDIGRPKTDLSLPTRLLIHFPFSIYLGWITVATIANISSVVASWGWEGFLFSEPTWSAVMMVVAAIVGSLLLVSRRNLAYAGVLVWALFGIRAAYPDISVIANTAVVVSVVLVISAVTGYVRTGGLRLRGQSDMPLTTAG